MILSETTYTDKDYDGLINELQQSADLDKELQYSRQAILTLNPNLYLMLLQAVTKSMEAAMPLKNNKSKISALRRLESKLIEHTNIIPADLPSAIINDRQLSERYLSDEPKVTFNDEAWQKFKKYIQDKVDSVPKKFTLPFLKWCLQMLEMNFARHNKICQRPGNCSVDQGYDRKIQFITKTIEDSTETNTPGAMKKDLNKIEWLGSQKELAELFVELKKKGWIEKFENQTIQDCFSNSKSVAQYLKPSTNTKTGENTFDALYEGYTPQFFAIKENSKRHK